MKNWVLLIFLAACVWAWFYADRQESEGCPSLAILGSDARFVSDLEQWVDESLKRGRLEQTNEIQDAPVMPGAYLVAIHDKKLEDRLGEFAQARVVLNGQRKIVAVFFGSRNFQGLIVDLPGVENVSVPSDIRTRISARTYRMCVSRD